MLKGNVFLKKYNTKNKKINMAVDLLIIYQKKFIGNQ
jgi:hypothetical protein